MTAIEIPGTSRRPSEALRCKWISEQGARNGAPAVLAEPDGVLGLRRRPRRRDRLPSAVSGLLAVLATAAAVAVRWLLDGWLHGQLPLVTLFAAVAAAVWFGGYRPALLVVVLGYLACDYLFIEPRGVFGLNDAPTLIGLLAHLFSCALIIGFGEATRAAHRRAKDQQESLRTTLASIGDAVITTNAEGRIEYLNAKRLDTARILASIVESSDDAIISKSLEGIIQSWNTAAEWLFGYSAERAVGQHISLIIPAERAGEENAIMEQLRSGRRVDHFETVRKRSDGQLVDVSLTISPIFDDAGTFVGASKIARNITEQKEAERRIYGLMRALTEADQRKDQFLATLAHELRGPLSPIRNSLEILKRAGGNGRLLEDSRSVVDRQLSQMERLIDDLLDISRITRNALELRKQRVELASVLYQAVEVCRSLADAAKVEIAVSLPSESIHLNGDPVRLSQVFSNLLNNSCKFTESGGCIWLTAKREVSEVVVSVKDNGIGIPSDMLTSIFETFTQVDQTLQRAHGGLGIGLSLVKQLVEMHDGTVEAFSDGPGLGCEFVVRLPILAEKPETAQPPAPTFDKQPTGCRILVVDDNTDSADSLSILLQVSGHHTQVAYDGQEAVAAAEQFRPEVVLLDIGLPKVNGLDACRRIREQPWGKGMVLIALTGWGQVEDRRKSQNAGFDAHLVKPVNYTELMNLLTSVQERQPTKC